VTELAAELALGPDADVADWARAGTDAMIGRIRATLGRFRCSFDTWFLERSLYESGAVARAIDRARAGGHVYDADGAVWLRSSALGDDKDRVLVRSDGTFTYVAGDLAYIADKLDRGFDTAVYVLGADHHGYIGRLKAAAQTLGYDPARIDVQIYQLVRLSEGKMSKRAGRIVTLDDLLDAIGVDAARYALVQRGHDQPIDLDLDLLTAQNAENPVYYCQYAHARIAAILRRADGGDAAVPDPSWQPEPAEAELVKALAEFPGLVAEAAERRGPHRIAGYAQDTAKAFHQFYKQCQVIGVDPPVERSRLALCRATARVMATALDLVGVAAPESM
jgi:arginyl-tRNA synthetase